MYCSDLISCSAAITHISLCPFVSLYEITQLSGQNPPIKMSAFSLNSHSMKINIPFSGQFVLSLSRGHSQTFTLCRDNN